MGRENEVSGIVRRISHDPRYLADSPFPTFNLPEGRRQPTRGSGLSQQLRYSGPIPGYRETDPPRTTSSTTRWDALEY